MTKVTKELLLELGFKEDIYGFTFSNDGAYIFIKHEDVDKTTVKMLFEDIICEYERRLEEEQWGEDW